MHVNAAHWNKTALSSKISSTNEEIAIQKESQQKAEIWKVKIRKNVFSCQTGVWTLNAEMKLVKVISELQNYETVRMKNSWTNVCRYETFKKNLFQVNNWFYPST